MADNADFQLYLIEGSLRTPVSEDSTPGDAAYNPILLNVDSTNINPPPSNAAVLEVELNVGFSCSDLSISAEGNNSQNWQFTLTDPVANPTTTVWSSGLSNQTLVGGTSLRFWLRANTFFDETPIQDVSVKIVPQGRIQATS